MGVVFDWGFFYVSRSLLVYSARKTKGHDPRPQPCRALTPASRMEIEKTNTWGVWMVDGRRCEGGLSQLARMVRTRSVGGIVLVR